MGNSQRKARYVVLIGDTGTGKSTIVEKLTGERGKSSKSETSFTKSSEVICVSGSNLIIADTPGSNALEDKLQHNVWIASAMNHRSVAKIFIVVKAETRIDTVISNVRNYADSFVELPFDVVAVLVTHMDTVTWTKNDFIPKLDNELGIGATVFSSMDTAKKTLLRDILEICTEEHDLTIDSENFLRLFKIHNHHQKILRFTSNELKDFIAKRVDFDKKRKAYRGKELVDLVFEFQTYMTQEIAEAKKRMCDKNNFTFYGDSAANEAGHIANLVNQLSAVLQDIRVECAGYQSKHGVSELRRCPHCGLIWTKVEGCDGITSCGSLPNSPNDVRDSSYTVLATFCFRWVSGELEIAKSGEKSVKSERSSSGLGCGNSISWNEMQTVPIPPEFEESVKISTRDITRVPPSANDFKQGLDEKLTTAGKNLSEKGKV